MQQDQDIRHPIAPTIMGVLVFGLSFLAPMSTPGEIARGVITPWQPVPGLFLLALLSGLTTVIARRFRWPLYVVATFGWLYYTMWPAAMTASLYAALAYKRRWQGVLYFVSATLLVVVPILTGASDFAYGLQVVAVMLLLMVALPYVAGLWIRTRRMLIAELLARNDRLEGEQTARAAQARAEERARIAREMHDVVAHQVAMIVLHAGALELSASEATVRSEAGIIATTGRAALNELRQLLGVLRRSSDGHVPAQPFLSNVDELVAQACAVGMPVSLTVDGSMAGLPSTVELSAYRLVQEALTNVAKHASGAVTSVQLRRLPSALDVVVNNGPGCGGGQVMPSSGLGLLGLRERVELLGGEFSAHSTSDGGFTVRAVVPLHPA